MAGAGGQVLLRVLADLKYLVGASESGCAELVNWGLFEQCNTCAGDVFTGITVIVAGFHLAG